MNREQLNEQIRRDVEASKTAYDHAAKKKVSQSHVLEIIRGRREPGEEVLRKLGFARTVTYRRIREEK